MRRMLVLAAAALAVTGCGDQAPQRVAASTAYPTAVVPARSTGVPTPVVTGDPE